jgi:hypothetical protein
MDLFEKQQQMNTIKERQSIVKDLETEQRMLKQQN